MTKIDDQNKTVHAELYADQLELPAIQLVLNAYRNLGYTVHVTFLNGPSLGALSGALGKGVEK